MGKGWEVRLADPDVQVSLIGERGPHGDNHGIIIIRGSIRDREGLRHAAWEPRAGDHVVIADHPNPQPRHIWTTDYDHDSKKTIMGVV